MTKIVVLLTAQIVSLDWPNKDVTGDNNPDFFGSIQSGDDQYTRILYDNKCEDDI